MQAPRLILSMHDGSRTSCFLFSGANILPNVDELLPGMLKDKEAEWADNATQNQSHPEFDTIILKALNSIAIF